MGEDTMEEIIELNNRGWTVTFMVVDGAHIALATTSGDAHTGVSKTSMYDAWRELYGGCTL